MADRSLREAPRITFERVTNEQWERAGTRRYRVLVDGVAIGTVERFRERYPHTSLGGNVALFRSRWSWRNGKSRMRFDSRKEAVRWLIEEVDRD